MRNCICVYGTPERIAEAKAIPEECETRNTELSVMGLHIEINDECNGLEARFSPKWQTEDGPRWELEERLADAVNAGEIDIS